MRAKKDMTGMRFGRLVVLHEDGRDKWGYTKWRCRCDCGNEVTVLGNSLRSGDTTSCGCFHRDRMTKHGLKATHRRVYDCVRLHFKSINKQVSGYTGWKLDNRYSNDMDGVVKFCEDLIALFPEECERYETDKTLNVDKDNDTEMTFRPESVVFISQRENLNNRKCTIRLPDGTPFADFCRSVGVVTCENRKPTNQYNKYTWWFRNHNGEAHPELMQKANETIRIYHQCIELIRLLDDVKKSKQEFKDMKESENDYGKFTK